MTEIKHPKTSLNVLPYHPKTVQSRSLALPNTQTGILFFLQAKYNILKVERSSLETIIYQGQKLQKLKLVKYWSS